MTKESIIKDIDSDLGSLCVTGATDTVLEDWMEKYVFLTKEEYDDLVSELNYHKMAAKAMSKLLGENTTREHQLKLRIDELENAINLAIDHQQMGLSYQAQKSAIIKLKDVLK